jgi:ribonuclease J
MIVHTGDYKFELDEYGQCALLADFERRATGAEILLLMADSTNIDRDGISPNEDMVRVGLRGVIHGAQQTIVLACFSSSISRVQSVLEIAQEADRKVAVCGFSLERNFGIASELGLLRYPADLIMPLRELTRLPARRRLILTTGTQGEPLSALSRLALNSFRGYTVQPGDSIVLSSRIIPGNERTIYRMINHFYRRGARVVTERDAMVHGSGHAYRGEMRRLLQALRPRLFMPVHGELRQLIGHRDLAIEEGIPEDNIFVLENGMHLDVSAGRAVRRETDWAGQVLVDGKMIDGVGEVVLRDRKHLSGDGMVTVILVIDRQSHCIIAGPDIVTRGFVVVDENEDLIEACKRVVIRTFEECEPESQQEWEVVKAAVRKALRKYLREQTDRFPVILPVVVEI